jgi:dihydroorotate dehydrogenase (fumarate)
LYEFQTYATAESLSYFPNLADYNVGPRDYLKLIESAKRSVSIPIVASLNGSTPGGWARYAKLMQDSGADALELNIYFVATDPEADSSDVEWRYIDLVGTVCDVVTVPVAVKIGPAFTSLSNFVPRLASAGARGVVLFNRFLEPDIDLATLRVTPQLHLSSRTELRTVLRWIGILRDQVAISLGATTGIQEPEDVVKALLVGADACLVTSALLRNGPDYVADLVCGLQTWLDENGYESVEQLKGSMSRGNCADVGNLERANYMKAIVSYTAAR